MNFLLCFLVWTASAAVYFKISSSGPRTLTPGDYLTSALGGFRLTLSPQTCQLQIETFEDSNYVVVGYFPRVGLAPCSNLSIRESSLASNNGNVLLNLRSGQRTLRFDEVFVTIDENAIVRISGIYNSQYQTSQNWISIFRTPQQFVFSISNLSVTRFNSLSFIQNSGRWGFSATNGELRIFRVDNPSKIVKYNYTGFTMTPGNLYDYESKLLPFADFRDFQYKSKCINSQNLSFQGPFTFIINPFWPELRLLDQNGYEIISVQYPSVNCTSLGLDYTLATPTCLSWFCPPNMFEHQGSCVATCPPPYFHLIGQDDIHRCVLTCRSDYQKDALIRVCSCTAPKLYECPAQLKPTPLGCLCANDTYFNPTNKAKTSSSLCQASCGPSFLNHPSGLCIPCPKHCLNCNLSSSSFNYLQCNQCQNGFKVHPEGYCMRECRESPGKVVKNNECLDCGVSFCRNCSQGVRQCSSCYIPYSLLNNSCIENCPRNHRTVLRSDKTYECQPISRCPNQLVEVRAINNQSQCFCLRSTASSIATAYHQCGTERPPCSLSQYYDSNTQQCLSCPVSCLTCELDASGQIDCTSCRPDYTMFVTLRNNNYCERNSILSFCPRDYNIEEQVCTLINVGYLAAMLSSRNMCFNEVKNCLICIMGSAKACSICSKGYYLHQGQCLQKCPKGTYPYRFQRVCLQRTVPNCIDQTEQSSYWLFRQDTDNFNSDALLNLLSVNFRFINPLNDPIGRILASSGSGTSQRQLAARTVNIASSYPQCLRCEYGYGISSMGGCARCIEPCVQCIVSRSNVSSCIKCNQYHRRVNSSCVQLDPTEMPCKNGEFRNESYICQPRCMSFFRPEHFLQGKNKTFEVNCTLNCPSSLAIRSSQSNGLVVCDAGKAEGDSQSGYIKFFGSKLSLNGQTLYSFITSQKIANSSNPILDVSSFSRTARKLQSNQANAKLQTVSTDFGFIIIDNAASSKESALVIELNVPAIRSSARSTYLGNSVYGFHHGAKAPIDIIFGETSNLYMYGRAFIFLLFFATVVFLGQQLSYKTDNIFITFTTIYLALTALNLTPSDSTFNCYSFMYGFAWSSYLEMLSNPRDLTANSGWFHSYLDRANNNAHFVLFVDNNIIRNCWSMLLFLMIAVGILGLAILVFKCFSVKKHGYLANSRPGFLQGCLQKWHGLGYSRLDFDHSSSAVLMLIFFVENAFTALTYYSFINLFNSTWQLASADKLSSFKAAAAVFIVLMCLYSLLRAYNNRIAGIYCFKRMAIGMVLGIVSVSGGIDENIVLSAILLVAVEAIFLGLRYRYEMVSDRINQFALRELKLPNKHERRMKITSRNTLPEKIALNAAQSISDNAASRQEAEGHNTEREKWYYMLAEEILIMLLYIFLVLVNVLKEGAILAIWLFVLIFMGAVGLQLFELGLRAWETAIDKIIYKNKPAPPYIRHIRNLYDHDLSMKSLAETTDH